MKLRGKADDRRRAANERAHSVLRIVDAVDDLGKRTVVADGARQNKRHVMAHAGLHDAVADGIFVDKFLDRAAAAHAVDRLQMMIMPHRDGFVRVDVLPERRVHQPRFQVVRGHGVARHEAVGIAVFDQRLHRVARIGVEHERGPEHPEDVAVFFFVAQKVVESVVIAGERRFARTALAERECIARVVCLKKAALV